MGRQRPLNLRASPRTTFLMSSLLVQGYLKSTDENFRIPIFHYHSGHPDHISYAPLELHIVTVEIGVAVTLGAAHTTTIWSTHLHRNNTTVVEDHEAMLVKIVSHCGKSVSSHTLRVIGVTDLTLKLADTSGEIDDVISVELLIG